LAFLFISSLGWAGEEKLTVELLNESLRLGRQFLLNQQKPEGNFNYEFHLVTGEISNRDSQVRQAGVLWSLALIHLNNPQPETLAAVEKGLEFFELHSRTTPSGGRCIAYPTERSGKTGTMALVALALIDFLRAEGESEGEQRWKTFLDEVLIQLMDLRMEDGLFYSAYSLESGVGLGAPSPYYDGEALLALTKAWRLLERDDLEPFVWDSAERMHRVHVAEALEKDPDSSVTKGYFFWACLSYLELLRSQGEEARLYGQRCLDLAVWMIDVHKTLERTRNTAYAQEGILAAWKCADLLDRDRLKQKFERTIHEGLYRLTTWQVGVSIENEYLREIDPNPLAVGGVMNKKDDPILRMDVT